LKKLFDYQGNLTIEALLKFVKGELSPEENKLIEEAASKSQLIAEAIDGFKHSSNLEKTKSSLESVNSEIFQRTGIKPITNEPPSFNKFKKPLLIGVAGLIVLLTSIWLINRNPSPTDQEKEIVKAEEVVPIEAPKETIIDTAPAVATDSQNIEEEPKIDPIQTSILPPSKIIEKDTLPAVIALEEDPIDSLGVNPIMALLPATAQKMEHWGKVTFKATEYFLNPKPKSTPKAIVIDTAVTVKNDTAGIQTKPEAKRTTVIDPPKEEKKKNNTTAVLKTDPIFKGGFAALQSYIAKNIDYPRAAERRGIDGTVFVKFIVTSKGDVRNPSVVIGVDKRLDKEALRIVEAMPRWAPASENGKAIQKEHSIPVKFTLPKGN
jgi:TonB family protein